MFKLIKEAEVYDPNPLGKKDILICGERIVKIAANINFPDALVIAKPGLTVIPGFIDQHVHITGGGGEGGFETRTPEVKMSDLIKGGVTTVVGLLGTDSFTRSIENLLAKTKALKSEGLSAYCLTGAYDYPSPTLLGNVGKDIAFIEEIIGVKLALSDHRESFITKEELKRLAGVVRKGALIAKKPGIIAIHIGDDERGLQLIFDIIKETSLPVWHFRPTHLDRNTALLQEAKLFLESGGRVDLTASSNPEKTLASLLELKKSSNQAGITISSDGNGSYSKYDSGGKLTEIGVTSCAGIYQTFRHFVQNGISLAEAASYGTINVARGLDLNKKGFIQVGGDADILILNQDLEIDTVLARGQLMFRSGQMVARDTF